MSLFFTLDLSLRYIIMAMCETIVQLVFDHFHKIEVKHLMSMVCTLWRDIAAHRCYYVAPNIRQLCIFFTKEGHLHMINHLTDWKVKYAKTVSYYAAKYGQVHIMDHLHEYRILDSYQAYYGAGVSMNSTSTLWLYTTGYGRHTHATESGLAHGGALDQLKWIYVLNGLSGEGLYATFGAIRGGCIDVLVWLKSMNLLRISKHTLFVLNRTEQPNSALMWIYNNCDTHKALIEDYLKK